MIQSIFFINHFFTNNFLSPFIWLKCSKNTFLEGRYFCGSYSFFKENFIFQYYFESSQTYFCKIIWVPLKHKIVQKYLLWRLPKRIFRKFTTNFFNLKNPTDSTRLFHNDLKIFYAKIKTKISRIDKL